MEEEERFAGRNTHPNLREGTGGQGAGGSSEKPLLCSCMASGLKRGWAEQCRHAAGHRGREAGRNRRDRREVGGQVGRWAGEKGWKVGQASLPPPPSHCSQWWVTLPAFILKPPLCLMYHALCLVYPCFCMHAHMLCLTCIILCQT